MFVNTKHHYSDNYGLYNKRNRKHLQKQKCTCRCKMLFLWRKFGPGTQGTLPTEATGAIQVFLQFIINHHPAFLLGLSEIRRKMQRCRKNANESLENAYYS